LCFSPLQKPTPSPHPNPHPNAPHNPPQLSAIHQRWGDHLYSKGEYDAAAAQYLGTIGHLEPSYVIRR